MLFDLRGRGRRRTVQVIYGTLAVLMAGGLVFFGIGGATSGGLFDAFSSGSTGSGNDIVAERVEEMEERVQANPSDSAAWARLTRDYYQQATSGDGFDEATGAFTEDGVANLLKSERAWDRYVALVGEEKIDPAVARVAVRGLETLQSWAKAVVAQQAVIGATETPNYRQYMALALYAHGAGQARVSTLAATRAEQLAPEDIREDVKTQIEQAKTQLDQAANAEQPS